MFRFDVMGEPALEITPHGISRRELTKEVLLARIETLEARVMAIEGVRRLRQPCLSHKGPEAMQLVCDEFDVTEGMLMGRQRLANLTFARQMGMWLAYRVLNMSSKQTGYPFKRDHGTVLWAFGDSRRAMRGVSGDTNITRPLGRGTARGGDEGKRGMNSQTLAVSVHLFTTVRDGAINEVTFLPPSNSIVAHLTNTFTRFEIGSQTSTPLRLVCHGTGNFRTITELIVTVSSPFSTSALGVRKGTSTVTCLKSSTDSTDSPVAIPSNITSGLRTKSMLYESNTLPSSYTSPCLAFSEYSRILQKRGPADGVGSKHKQLV